MNPRSLESWDEINWRPRDVHDLGGERYLVLVEASGRGRGSGHIVQLSEGRAQRLDTYLGWDAARQAAGIG
jgi:hypothetical protein